MNQFPHPIAPEALPAPPPGAIHTWRFPLDLPESVQPGLRALLDDTERARADRFYRRIHGDRFTAARATLRRVLAACTGVPPVAIRFGVQARGKPYLIAPESDIRFNLSHSGDQGIIAVARGIEVGVDIEGIRENDSLPKIARRYFAPPEYEALQGLPESDREAAFYQCWTAKEALIKAWGLGLHAPLDRFAVEVAPGRTRLCAMDIPGFDPAAWDVQAVSAGAGFAAALAWEGPEVTIVSRCLDPSLRPM
ncbi:MAG: 4'-phosphopantetheinyl transferase superfamily protein [Candidatus Hydrogenedentes bacterium]|nr:4'-phosphopantetheinyl transferase superfamily protein [Candidatus Hydrogenedentota bacterium]